MEDLSLSWCKSVAGVQKEFVLGARKPVLSAKKGAGNREKKKTVKCRSPVLYTHVRLSTRERALCLRYARISLCTIMCVLLELRPDARIYEFYRRDLYIEIKTLRVSKTMENISND